MRVTSFILEYVREEMHKKFQPAIDAVDPDYTAKRNELVEACERIAARANEEALELCKSANMLTESGGDLIHFSSSYRIRNRDIEDERNKKTGELLSKRDQAVRDILLRLEIGETSKNDLKAAIDEVTVE